MNAKDFRSSELGLRIASAIVMVIFTLGVSVIGGWIFSLFCAAISLIVFYEWQKMVSVTPFDVPEAILSLGFLAVVSGALFGFFWWALITFLAVGLVLELVSKGEERAEVLWMGLGALYCAIPVFALPLVRETGGVALLMLLYFAVWGTDVGAYFAGRQFGGPKLLPAVSPKKTWSGAIGGAVAAIVLAYIVARLNPDLSIWPAIILAFVLSVISQKGDLFESWVKRIHNVKDSSNLIPGHGGVLDRVDGLVAAALALALWLSLGSG